jgi:hypothetical protein
MTSRKRWLGCGGLLAVLVVLFLALPTRKILFPKHYDVVSIATLPVYKDEARMTRARAQAGVSGYPSPPLYQSKGSLCGPTSLANVFRSFGDANATASDVLAGSGKCTTGVCFMGLTLEEEAELARRKPGYRVTILRDLTIVALRRELADASTNAERRYIANFDRGPLFGKEGGHHSPIGGYLPDDDLVLVLDVNAKYAPWLTKTERLLAAMNTIDEGTGKTRGLLVIEKANP